MALSLAEIGIKTLHTEHISQLVNLQYIKIKKYTQQVELVRLQHLREIDI